MGEQMGMQRIENGAWKVLVAIGVFLSALIAAIVGSGESLAELRGDLGNRNDRGLLKRPSEKHVTR